MKKCFRNLFGIVSPRLNADCEITLRIDDYSASEQTGPLLLSIVEFCRFVRDNGLPNGLQQTLDAIEVVKTVGVTDREELAFALRTVLSSSKEEWHRFDELFETFWSESQRGSMDSSGEGKETRLKGQRPQANSRALSAVTAGEASSRDREGRDVTGASAQKRLQKVDLSDVPLDDLAALEEISLRLFRKLSLRLSRRRKIKNLAERVDVRRTIRRSISRGGDPIDLAFQGKKLQKSNLVIFLDISGSMNSYSLFLVRFAYALQKYFKSVNTFLFSTSAVEITDLLRNRDLSTALRELSQRAAGWASGTKIGESLRELNPVQRAKLLRHRTVFIILSDGWDTGDPEVLVSELRAIRRRVQKLVWLNPLLGLEDYEPVTRGMSAALQYIDVFAPAHNLESLVALDRHL